MVWRDVRTESMFSVPNDAELLIAGTMQLVAAQKDRAAVRAIIERVDEWMHAQELDLCNALLEKADPQLLGITASLGLLTALDPVRDKTRRTRDEFIARLHEYLWHTRPYDADELMSGIR